MSGLGVRHVAHMVLNGPDAIAFTNLSEIAEAFRRDTALTIARGDFGERIVPDAQDRMRSVLEERQEGRRAAATSIGARVNRLA